MALMPESWLNNARLIASNIGRRYARQDSPELPLKGALRRYALSCAAASWMPRRCSTVVASARRPLTASQRGLWGITNSRLRNTAAGTAPDNSFQRQTSAPDNTADKAKLLR